MEVILRFFSFPAEEVNNIVYQQCQRLCLRETVAGSASTNIICEMRACVRLNRACRFMLGRVD